MSKGVPASGRRRNKSESAALDRAIVEIVNAERPLDVAGICERLVALGLVDNSECMSGNIGLRVHKLRKAGAISDSDIIVRLGRRTSERIRALDDAIAEIIADADGPLAIGDVYDLLVAGNAIGPSA